MTKLQVTSEIIKITLAIAHASFFIFYMGILIRCLLSTFSETAIFCFVNLLKLSFILLLGSFNASFVIQFFIIFNHSWVQLYDDAQIVKRAGLFIVGHLFFNCIEYFLVRLKNNILVFIFLDFIKNVKTKFL